MNADIGMTLPNSTNVRRMLLLHMMKKGMLKKLDKKWKPSNNSQPVSFVNKCIDSQMVYVFRGRPTLPQDRVYTVNKFIYKAPTPYEG